MEKSFQLTKSKLNIQTILFQTYVHQMSGSELLRRKWCLLDNQWIHKIRA